MLKNKLISWIPNIQYLMKWKANTKFLSKFVRCNIYFCLKYFLEFNDIFSVNLFHRQTFSVVRQIIVTDSFPFEFVHKTDVGTLMLDGTFEASSIISVLIPSLTLWLVICSSSSFSSSESRKSEFQKKSYNNIICPSTISFYLSLK